MTEKIVKALRVVVWIILTIDILMIFSFAVLSILENPITLYLFSTFSAMIIFDMHLWKYQKIKQFTEKEKRSYGKGQNDYQHKRC